MTRRLITKADVFAVLREHNDSITDLAREYGMNADDETQAIRDFKLGRNRATDKGAKVAEHFMERDTLGLAPDVAEIALNRGLRTMDRMAEIVDGMDEDDPQTIRLVATYISAVWMSALTIGIALGRRFPLEERQDV